MSETSSGRPSATEAQAGAAEPWRRLVRGAPYLAGVAVFALALALGAVLRAHEAHHVRLLVGYEARYGIPEAVQVVVRERRLALERMARRWAVADGTPPEQWEADARAYLDHQPGYRAIGWLDPARELRRAVPVPAELARLAVRHVPEAAGDEVRVVDPREGAGRLLLFAPIRADGRFGGFIVALVDGAALLDPLLRHAANRGFAVAVLHGGERLLGAAAAAASPDAREGPLALGDGDWRVVAAPTPALWAEHRTRLPELAFISGALVALLVGFAVDRSLAARASAGHLRMLIETAPDAVVIIDEQGTVEDCNLAAAQMFGYDPADLPGHNVKVLMPSPHRERHDGYLKRYCDEGGPRIIGIGREVEAQRRDGSVFPVRLAVGEMRTGGGRRHFVGFIADIGERVRAQCERERYLAELEHSNRELDDFAYIASHDLKEPLRGIHNFAGFLLEDYGERLPEDGQAKLRTLQRLSMRMERLLDDLLRYSRVGRQQLALEPLDMNRLLDEVREALNARLEEAGGTLVVAQPLPPAKGDWTRVGEVLQNLIANALKYNDSPAKRVEVGAVAAHGAARALPPGHRLFYVRDNGIGIREKHLESVFGIFKRLHGRDRYGGGSGAGLTIARKVIERHGGVIWAESAPGAGSTFYFTLPGGDMPWPTPMKT